MALTGLKVADHWVKPWKKTKESVLTRCSGDPYLVYCTISNEPNFLTVFYRGWETNNNKLIDYLHHPFILHGCSIVYLDEAWWFLKIHDLGYFLANIIYLPIMVITVSLRFLYFLPTYISQCRILINFILLIIV